MKINNARVRIGSIWRDINEIIFTKNKINIVAKNGDKFEFDRDRDINDTAFVISLYDLFSCIAEINGKTDESKPKKTTKKKEPKIKVDSTDGAGNKTEE